VVQHDMVRFRQQEWLTLQHSKRTIDDHNSQSVAELSKINWRDLKLLLFILYMHKCWVHWVTLTFAKT